jgi:hypothetical protein
MLEVGDLLHDGSIYLGKAPTPDGRRNVHWWWEEDMLTWSHSLPMSERIIDDAIAVRFEDCDA